MPVQLIEAKTDTLKPCYPTSEVGLPYKAEPHPCDRLTKLLAIKSVKLGRNDLQILPKKRGLIGHGWVVMNSLVKPESLCYSSGASKHLNSAWP